MKLICLFLISQWEPANLEVFFLLTVTRNAIKNTGCLLTVSFLKLPCRTAFKVAVSVILFANHLSLYIDFYFVRLQNCGLIFTSLLNTSCHKSSWMPEETLQMDSVWHSWLQKEKRKSWGQILTLPNVRCNLFMFTSAGPVFFLLFCLCKKYITVWSQAYLLHFGCTNVASSPKEHRNEKSTSSFI